jgi:hypothetical protein
MFHVKFFGAIGGLRKCTFAERGWVRSGDLAQAENCDRVYFLALQFLEDVFRAVRNFHGFERTAVSWRAERGPPYPQESLALKSASPLPETIQLGLAAQGKAEFDFHLVRPFRHPADLRLKELDEFAE